MKPGRNGGRLLAGGKVGHKGGGGRPRNDFREFLAQAVRGDEAARATIQENARDRDHRNWSKAWQIATEYDPDKPARRIELDVTRIKRMSDEELKAIVAGKK